MKCVMPKEQQNVKNSKRLIDITGEEEGHHAALTRLSCQASGATTAILSSGLIDRGSLLSVLS